MPRLLIDVAKRCRGVYDKCAEQSSDLFGCSVLDLCADQLPDVPLADLKAAIVIAGIEAVANERIKKQIWQYRF